MHFLISLMKLYGIPTLKAVLILQMNVKAALLRWSRFSDFGPDLNFLLPKDTFFLPVASAKFTDNFFYINIFIFMYIN